MLSSIGSVLLLAFGFGFVIFFHEMGHFLAAKWADVKVEQFAVGFGSAMLAWRKGLGFHWGTTQPAFKERLTHHIEHNHPDWLQIEQKVHGPTDEQLARAAAELQISETEYRLNWIPLGGYVKMLGQDDMKPGQTVNDPRAYNNKSISQRMVIVSAGVVMNVILAAVGFMTIFLVGFKVKPAIVGAVLPGSPAQQTYKMEDGKQVTASLQPGDRILYMDNKYQSDFEKIQLNTALLAEGPVPLYVQHPNGQSDHLTIIPKKGDNGEFLLLGVMPAYELQGPKPSDKYAASDDRMMPDAELIKNGDVITQVNGDGVKPDQFWKLNDALQKSNGKPIELTIQSEDGKTRTAKVHPHFMDRFGGDSVNFAGLLMRPKFELVRSDSPVKDKIQPGDVVTSFYDSAPGGDRATDCTRDELMKWLNQAGHKGQGLTITVLRDGKEVVLKDLRPTLHLPPDRFGIGVGLGMDDEHAVVAGTLEGSPAAAAGVSPGAQITSVNGQPVQSWFDVNRILAKSTVNEPITLMAMVDQTEKTYSLGKLSAEQISEMQSNQLTDDLLLRPAIQARKTNNPLIAAAWGAGETRDAILQVYQTVRAMVVGHSISVRQVSGPVGILAAGYRFAEMGTTRLIWFLSIISANLAVMNFLPIPIVDGGLFTFLIIEKIKGGPISPRVQAVAQVVGLAILLSVFVFATYQDVFYRLPFMSH